MWLGIHKDNSRSVPGMKEGELVECIDTGRIGIILDKNRNSRMTFFLIMWTGAAKAHWVDGSDIKPHAD